MTQPPQRAQGQAAMPQPQPLLGRGTVRHRRLRPRPHAFAYPTWFLLLPLRTLRAQPAPALPRNRRGLFGFHDRDHGDGRADALAWIDELLLAEGIADADGEVWLQTYPRLLGFVFKPVSFWFCERRDGTLAAIVVEVNNTFGERHCYLLAGPQLGWGRELVADKCFHVSPFCSVEGRYRFRFLRTPGGCTARIDHDDAAGPLLQTSIAGALQPLTARAARAAILGQPLLTLAIVARIHWQALVLWAKRTPFTAKPAPPSAFVSR